MRKKEYSKKLNPLSPKFSYGHYPLSVKAEHHSGYSHSSSHPKVLLQKKIHEGKFGGHGTFASMKTVEKEIRTLHHKHVPFKEVVDRLVPLEVWHKHKHKEIAARARHGIKYAARIYDKY